MEESPTPIVLIYPDGAYPFDVLEILAEGTALSIEVLCYSEWGSLADSGLSGLICVRDDGTWLTVKGPLGIAGIKDYIRARQISQASSAKGNMIPARA